MAWRRSNPLALAVLVTLFDQPRHPYDISQTLRYRHHHESMRLNFGSLYAVVGALDREGFIEPHEVEREGRRPERTVYRITDAGVAEARRWLAEMLSTPTKEYLDFEAALTLIGAIGPDEALQLLEHRLAALKVRLAESVAGRQQAAEAFSLPRLFMVESEYVEALQAAEIEFVGRLVEELRSGTFPDLDQWRAWSHRDDAPPSQPHTPPPSHPQTS